MSWLSWVFLSIIALSLERVFNRKILADTDHYWDYLIGYNAGAVVFLLAATPIELSSISWIMAPLLILSGALWFACCVLSFKADQMADVSLTSFLAQLQLVLVFAGGVFLFGEPVTSWRLIGLTLILCGIGCRQSLATFFNPGVLFKLASVVNLSAALLLDKRLSASLEASLITLSGFGIPLFLSVLLRPTRALRAARYARAVGFGNLFTGALSSLSYFALVKAMVIAPISLVMPVFQLNLIVALFAGYLLLGEKRDLLARFGAGVLVVLGAIAIQW